MHRIEPAWLNYAAHPCAAPFGFATAHEKLLRAIFSSFGLIFYSLYIVFIYQQPGVIYDQLNQPGQIARLNFALGVLMFIPYFRRLY
jgi:hypothetical protein